jgi:hypothetical protein
VAVAVDAVAAVADGAAADEAVEGSCSGTFGFSTLSPPLLPSAPPPSSLFAHRQ